MKKKFRLPRIRWTALSPARVRWFHPAVVAIAAAIVWGLANSAAFAAEKQVIIRLWDQKYFLANKHQQQLFKEFTKANPDIKVEYTSMPVDAYQKELERSFRVGDPPDIFYLGEANPLRDLLEKGWVMPLDKVAPSRDELQAWMHSFPKERQPFLENVNMFFSMIYAWPTLDEVGRVMLFWNTRLFREAGLRGLGGEALAPETWDDIRHASMKITELGQGKVYGIVHGIKDPGTWDLDVFSGIATSAGWPWGGFDFRTGCYDFHHSGLKGSIQLWFDLKKDGSIYPGDISMTYSQAGQEVFARNLGGMKFGGPADLNLIWIVTNSLENYDTTLPPIPAKGERKGYVPIQPLAVFSDYAVSSMTKNRDAVWRVIRFITSQEYQEGLAEAGTGASHFPILEKTKFYPESLWTKIAVMVTTGRRIAPKFYLSKTAQKAWSYMKFDPMKEATDVMQGMWTGKLGWDAWDDLERRANAAFDKALADAQKDGLMVTRTDFTFPDWDPAENYPPPRAKK